MYANSHDFKIKIRIQSNNNTYGFNSGFRKSSFI